MPKRTRRTHTRLQGEGGLCRPTRRQYIDDCIHYFNEERPHQGLDNMTPDDVYYRRKPLPEAA